MFQQFVASSQTMEALFACAPFCRANVVVNGPAALAGHSSPPAISIAGLARNSLTISWRAPESRERGKTPPGFQDVIQAVIVVARLMTNG
jgi:hypothetical protein